MCPALSMNCGLAARACSPCACMCALVDIITVACCDDLSGSLPWMDHCFGQYISSFLCPIDGSLLWSTYLQFPCPIELCGSLIWWPILPIQCPALPKPHRKRFSDSWEGLGQVSFSTEVPSVWQCWGWLLTGLVPTHRVAMEPPYCAWNLRRAPINLW